MIQLYKHVALKQTFVKNTTLLEWKNHTLLLFNFSLSHVCASLELTNMVVTNIDEDHQLEEFL